MGSTDRTCEESAEILSTPIEEDIVLPSKGYNLDFLDNLDDPNFNHFETKTAVKNQFEASEVVPSATQNEVAEVVQDQKASGVSDISSENKQSASKSEESTVAKKPKKTPMKPNMKKKKSPSPQKVVNTVEEENVED